MDNSYLSIPNNVAALKHSMISIILFVTMLFFFYLNTDDETFFWGNPREIGSLIEVNGETFYASYTVGLHFMTLEELRRRDLLKGGDAIFSFTMQGWCP